MLDDDAVDGAKVLDSATLSKDLRRLIHRKWRSGLELERLSRNLGVPLRHGIIG